VSTLTFCASFAPPVGKCNNVWTLRFRGLVVVVAIVVNSWLVATSGIYWLATSAVCLVAPTLFISFCRHIYFREEFYFRSEFYFRFDVYFSASPRSWPVTMAEDGPAPERVTAGIAAAAGPPERNPTCRIGRCNLRYGLDLSPFLQPAVIYELLTNWGKFAQPAEARKWLFTVTASLKTLGFLRGNEGIDRGNLSLTVGILSVKSRNYNVINAVFTVNIK